MILLAIFDAFYAILEALTSFFLPALPSEVTSVLVYVLEMVQNGLNIVLYLAFDANIVSSLAVWSLTAFLAFYALDLAWRVIGMIKLSRKN